MKTNTIHRSRLFLGICLALVPTGLSFALVSNILVQLKQEFILTNYQVGLIGGAALGGWLAGEPVVAEAAAILQPAEAYGGQRSFRYAAPAALILIVVFGTMYVRDRQQGGYRVVRLERVREQAVD